MLLFKYSCIVFPVIFGVGNQTSCALKLDFACYFLIYTDCTVSIKSPRYALTSSVLPCNLEFSMLCNTNVNAL